MLLRSRINSIRLCSALLSRLIAAAEPADLILAEGSMGLFDGVAQPGASGTGATADIAALAGWPVVLVLDVGGQAQTAGAVALGLARFRADVSVAGVIVNRVASARHLALARAGMSIDDVDLVEINEAFAAQVLPSAEDLGIPLDKLNVNGGAIALGHPWGMTGARITATLLNSLREHDKHIGLETMCVGGGQGMAVVYERLS